MTEAARTFTPPFPVCRPISTTGTHYGVKDAGAGQDDLRLRVGDGASRSGDTRSGAPVMPRRRVWPEIAGAQQTPAQNINLQSMVALVLSVLGVTAPIGVFLAYLVAAHDSPHRRTRYPVRGGREVARLVVDSLLRSGFIAYF